MAMFLDSLLQQKEAIMKKWHLKVLEARGTWHMKMLRLIPEQLPHQNYRCNLTSYSLYQIVKRNSPNSFKYISNDNIMEKNISFKK